MSGCLLQSAQTKQLLTILFSSTAQPFQVTAAALQAAFGPALRFPALCSALLLLQARACTDKHPRGCHALPPAEHSTVMHVWLYLCL